MEVGEAIRAAREEAGLSQEGLAQRAQISRVYVAQLEANKKSPTLDVFSRLAAALGVRASTLLARAERAVRDRGD